jgi:hypothetical protein
LEQDGDLDGLARAVGLNADGEDKEEDNYDKMDTKLPEVNVKISKANKRKSGMISGSS